MKNFSKIFFVFFFAFKFAYASETINIKDIRNNIFVLDIYGNRYLATKNNKLKSGHFLRSIKKPAILLMDNNKICFSKNSSIKIKSINKSKKLINIIVLKGKFVFSANHLSGFKYHIKINNNIIENNLGNLFLSKKPQNSFSIKTYKDASYLYTNSSKKMKLNPNSFYDFKSKVTSLKIKNDFKKSDFLNQCFNKNYTSNLIKEFKYKCSTLKNKIYCGYE